MTFTFLHGMNNDATVWAPVIRSLDGLVKRSFAPDLQPLSSVEEIADDVAESAPPGVLVGHSFGGAVAMAMLERNPRLVTHLVLVASSLGADTPEQADARRKKADRLDTESDYIDFAVELMPKVYHPTHAADTAMRDARRRSVRTYGLQRFKAHSYAIGNRPDRTTTVRNTTVPILVVAPESDTVILPERQEQFARDVRADFQVVASAGHMLPAERPEELAAVIEDWLRRNCADNRARTTNSY
ncbi:alpha/beta fold hydrolase [Dietzia sp. NPDC055340]